MTVSFRITDRGLHHALEIRKGVCEFHDVVPEAVDVALSFTAAFLVALVSRQTTWMAGIASGDVTIEGEQALAGQFFASFEPPMAPHEIKLVSR